MKFLNEITLTPQLTYLLQTSNSFEYSRVTSWIFNHTQSISSTLALITLITALSSIAIKAKLSAKKKAQENRRKSIEATKLKLLESIQNELLKLKDSEKFINKLTGTDKENFEKAMTKTEELKKIKEEV